MTHEFDPVNPDFDPFEGDSVEQANADFTALVEAEATNDELEVVYLIAIAQMITEGEYEIAIETIRGLIDSKVNAIEVARQMLTAMDRSLS